METTYKSESLKNRYDKIRSSNGSIKLTKGPMVVLHIIPVSSGLLDLSAFADDHIRVLALLLHGTNPQKTINNSLIFYNDNLSYLELPPNGEIEIASSLNSLIMSRHENKHLFESQPSLFLSDYEFERHLCYCIKRNIRFYREQGQNKIKTPIEIHLALLNIKNLELQNLNGNQYPDNDLILNREVIDDFQTDLQTNLAINNIADQIWIAFGGSQSIHFNHNHTFIESQN